MLQCHNTSEDLAQCRGCHTNPAGVTVGSTQGLGVVLLGVTARSEHCSSRLGASVSKGEHVFNMLHQQRAAAGCCKRSRGFVNSSERAAVTAEIETSPLCSEFLPQGFNLDQEKQTAPCRYQDLACNTHTSPQRGCCAPLPFTCNY